MILGAVIVLKKYTYKWKDEVDNQIYLIKDSLSGN
jgi:hypothetical protein